MRVLKPRNRGALAVLALAAAAVFVLPASSASAGSATVANACANSVTANFSQIEVTTSGSDGVDAVPPGGALTLSGLSQNGAVPGAIFVAGYNLGLLVVGNNDIPATVNTKIEGTNTTQGTQTTSNASTSVSTTISDPDGTPGTGDETGTDATFTANYANLSWTAGASGTIDYRQESIATWPATDANNTLRIQAVVGGFLNVIFRCAPGTVTPPDPGTVALIDPAPSFDTTGTCLGPPAISIDDQTVAEGGAATFTVSLGGCPGEATVDFASSDGTAIAPEDYTPTSGTLTFAPGVTSQPVTVQTIDDNLVEPNETFNLNLSNPTNGATIADAQGVGTILEENELADAAGDLIVNGPVSSTKTSKSFVFKVSNVGLVPITVAPATDISARVDVNGTTTGSVSPNSGTKTLGPGSSTRVKLVWSYPAGSLATGDSVVFNACVNVAGDIDTSNDCDSASATAK